MTAEDIAKGLGGRRAGGGWAARCPAHDDHTPSLSICKSGNITFLDRAKAPEPSAPPVDEDPNADRDPFDDIIP